MRSIRVLGVLACLCVVTMTGCGASSDAGPATHQPAVRNTESNTADTGNQTTTPPSAPANATTSSPANAPSANTTQKKQAQESVNELEDALNQLD